MPVPVWEANDSFSKFDQDTEGRIDICALPAALTEFYTAFHIPQPARLANTVVSTSAEQFLEEGRISFKNYLELLLRHKFVLPQIYRDEFDGAVREVREICPTTEETALSRRNSLMADADAPWWLLHAAHGGASQVFKLQCDTQRQAQQQALPVLKRGKSDLSLLLEEAEDMTRFSPPVSPRPELSPRPSATTDSPTIILQRISSNECLKDKASPANVIEPNALRRNAVPCSGMDELPCRTANSVSSKRPAGEALAEALAQAHKKLEQSEKEVLNLRDEIRSLSTPNTPERPSNCSKCAMFEAEQVKQKEGERILRIELEHLRVQTRDKELTESEEMLVHSRWAGAPSDSSPVTTSPSQPLSLHRIVSPTSPESSLSPASQARLVAHPPQKPSTDRMPNAPPRKSNGWFRRANH